ncbi:MAG: hypothetical protein CXT78_04230 [Thaumarchaeota archaeon]|nr:MAG: hypothetical protein CXT78_04230 [Nitrososphaerota archaeon]
MSAEIESLIFIVEFGIFLSFSSHFNSISHISIDLTILANSDVCHEPSLPKSSIVSNCLKSTFFDSSFLINSFVPFIHL